MLRRLGTPSTVRHSLRQQRGIDERCEIDEPDTVLELLVHIGRDLQGEARLPTAPAPVSVSRRVERGAAEPPRAPSRDRRTS